MRRESKNSWMQSCRGARRSWGFF